MEYTPYTFSLVEEGGMKREPGLVDMSGIIHRLEDDQEDSITASCADQREEGLGMLTNLESLPLERIYQMLRIFAMQGPAVEYVMRHAGA